MPAPLQRYSHSWMSRVPDPEHYAAVAFFGQRLFAIAGSLPLIGHLTSLISRVTLYIYERFLPREDPLLAMEKNTRKALAEHNSQYEGESPYISAEEFLLLEKQELQEKPPLALSFASAQEAGFEQKMQDRLFFHKMEEGIITAVLDGHGGFEVADYVKEKFPDAFSRRLQECEGNIRYALEAAIEEVNQEILQHKEWEVMGSTAAISFIDPKKRLIYTATLGDSEVNVYRKNKSGRLQSIPLSCIRDWSSNKDFLRGQNFHKYFQVEGYFPLDQSKIEEPKEVRITSPKFKNTLNVSRSFGDKSFRGTDEYPGIISKPKITLFELQEGDLIVLASDGLKDSIEETEIVRALTKNKGFLLEDKAKALIEAAYEDDGSLFDDTAVLVIEVKASL